VTYNQEMKDVLFSVYTCLIPVPLHEF